MIFLTPFSAFFSLHFFRTTFSAFFRMILSSFSNTFGVSFGFFTDRLYYDPKGDP